MPQFDLSNFAPQLAWLAVFFAILYFGIVRLTLPKIDKVADERERRVGDDLAAAAASKSASDAAREGHEAAMAKAQADAQAALKAAREEAGKATEGRLKIVAADLDTQAQAAQARLAASRDQALAEVDRIAAQAVSDIVTRLTGHTPGEAAATAAVAAAR